LSGLLQIDAGHKPQSKHGHPRHPDDLVDPVAHHTVLHTGRYARDVLEVPFETGRPLRGQDLRRLRSGRASGFVHARASRSQELVEIAPRTAERGNERGENSRADAYGQSKQRHPDIHPHIESVCRQTYIEDCEVCCRRIEIFYAIEDESLVEFKARRNA